MNVGGGDKGKRSFSICDHRRRFAFLLDIGLCIVAAFLLLAATPGFGLWPCVFFAFILIHWIFDRAKLKAWLAATIIGFIYYTIGISWISVPMTIFGGAPQIAGVGLVLFTGIVSTVWFWLPYGYVMGRYKNPLLGAMVFIALEMMKGKYLFGGLPWLNIGLTQFNNYYTLQLAALIGEHGISFVIIIFSAYLYKIIILRAQNRRDIYIAAVFLVLLFGYGFIKLQWDKLPEHSHTARMVQTGIFQEDKWEPSKRGLVYEQLLERVGRAATAEGDFDLIILPESSFTVNPFTNRGVRNLITFASRESPLFLGYDRRGDDGKLYNDMAMVLNGEVVQDYSKMRLAPFGEYFPFEKQLWRIRVFFFGDGELFSAGTTPVIFSHNDMKIAPLICFEGVFSGIIRERIFLGANVIVLISNDAWFGESLGRVQHMEIEAMRAAEYGRYMLRVTQDGITTVINPHGRKEAVFPEKQFYFADVGFSLRDNITPFARLGYIWYVLLIVGFGVRLYRDKS